MGGEDNGRRVKNVKETRMAKIGPYFRLNVSVIKVRLENNYCASSARC